MTENEEYSDDSLFNIASWGADMSFRELIQMYQEDELVRPEFQRYYVWSKTEASRFIESLLLGLPVPSIFLANYKKGQKLIIDGYQRIMTVYDYVQKGRFGQEENEFRLINSNKVNAKWRNKAFSELTQEEQRKIRSSTIHAIIFEQKLPKDDDTSMFQIFSRINSSGRTLNAQEIRNCVCQGPFNTMLLEINKTPAWRSLYGSDSSDSRMQDVELILRFFAMRDMKRIEKSKKQINLRKYLDLYMRKCREEDLGSMRKDFERMSAFVLENMGSLAFTSTLEGSKRSKINPTIFDAISIATDAYLKNGGAGSVDYEYARTQLLSDNEFASVIRYRTTNIDHIEKRISIAKKILFNIES